MNGHQVGLAWLYAKLQTLTALTALIGSGNAAKAYEAGKVPPTATFPYLTAQVITTSVPTPIGGRPSAWVVVVDLALWDRGEDDTAITAANDAISAALEACDPELFFGMQVSCGIVAPLPPAPPPVQPGEPTTVRLGSSYEIFVGAT